MSVTVPVRGPVARPPMQRRQKLLPTRLPPASWVVAMGGLYGAALLVFLLRALPIYTTADRLLAWMLFVVGTLPAARLAFKRQGVPLFPLVTLQYVVFFSLPVFFESDFHLQRSGAVVPDATAITLALGLALLALMATAGGYAASSGLMRRRIPLLSFLPDPGKLFAYGAVVVTGSLLLEYGILALLVPAKEAGLARPLELLFSRDLGLAILACVYHARMVPRWKRILTVLLVGACILSGFIGGMFQAAIQPIVIWLICGWVVRRKFPFIWVGVLAAAFFILQPVKGIYRGALRDSVAQLSLQDKARLYSTLVKDYWSKPGSQRSQGILEESKRSAANRLSMLLSTAHYIEWTPYPIPYKNGSTLSFLVYTWIPRAVWPGKPVAQEANKILPVEYDVQDARNLDTTMFGVGHLAEVYANFGALGVIPVFLLLGVLYRLPQLMLERHRTLATTAIFAAVMLAMVPIGSSIGDAFGGFVQQIIIHGVMLRFFTASRRARGSRYPASATRPVRRLQSAGGLAHAGSTLHRGSA